MCERCEEEKIGDEKNQNRNLELGSNGDMDLKWGQQYERISWKCFHNWR